MDTHKSFFVVVSMACSTSVPAFWKCMDISSRKKKSFDVEKIVHRLLHLFVGLERLALTLLSLNLASISGKKT